VARITAFPRPKKAVPFLACRVLEDAGMGEVHAHAGDALASQVNQVGGTIGLQALHDGHVGVAIVLAAVAVPIMGVVEEDGVSYAKLVLLFRVDPVLAGQVIERRGVA